MSLIQKVWISFMVSGQSPTLRKQVTKPKKIQSTIPSGMGEAVAIAIWHQTQGLWRLHYQQQRSTARGRSFTTVKGFGTADDYPQLAEAALGYLPNLAIVRIVITL